MSREQTAAKPTRRGTVAILVVMSITLLLGVVAITLDGGLLQDNKRRVQNAADSAALAAANRLFSNYPAIVKSGIADPDGSAVAAALKSAGDNGFPNSADTNVVVNIPPQSGPFTNKFGYAEIIITYKQPRYFSTIWGSTSTPITARAVGKGFWGGSGTGILVLDPNAKDALDSSGGPSGIVTGGAAVIVDSNHPEAARATGGGGLTADRFEVTGGTTGTFNGTVETGVPPTPDPLAYLPVPSVPPDGTITKTSLGNGNHQYTLNPGRYTNLPSFNVGDVVVFQQASAGNGGIFYIDGGGFTSTGATIMMDPNTSGGVMLYNNPTSGAQSGGISISGNSAGSVTLSALTSGPYAGILFWQNRTAAQSLSISGQGSFNLTGTIYAANANMQISGNGSAIIGSQYISRTLNLSGNGAVLINYSDQGTARIREVRLVE